MCLFPKLILNKKYLNNKKNNYHAPNLIDERVKYVPIGCGECIECRKQKAREWQVRLAEEIKTNKALFVTLTFSEESLQKLRKELNTKDDNKVATLAVRRFCERWRKSEKKSVKHWLITELGHENTERIHLHGLIFDIREELIKQKWQYGIADFGTYVNMRTINYIIKYVTKIDNDHKEYKPIILCSAGIGKNYINTYDFKTHKYRPKDTKDFYTLPNGNKINNPIYYRNKLYNEEEREQLWRERLDKKEIYVCGVKYPIKTQEEIDTYLQALKNAREQNKRAGYGNGEIQENYKELLNAINQ